MVLHCSIVAASILLVLISKPADVKGTCICADTCPNYKSGCWFLSKKTKNAQRIVGALMLIFMSQIGLLLSAKILKMISVMEIACVILGAVSVTLLVVNLLLVPVAYLCLIKLETYFQKKRRKLVPLFVTLRPSWQKEKVRVFLANKYCVEEDQVVCEDIHKIILSEVLNIKLAGITLSEVVAKLGSIDNVLTCDLSNKEYIDVSHLTLCEDKQQHLAVVPASTTKGKKQKKTP